MKVFVVTNQCVTHDSSYYEVIAACSTLDEAQTVLGTCEADFIKGLELNEGLGIENSDFHCANINIEEESMQLTITDEKTGMFDKYTIHEVDLY